MSLREIVQKEILNPGTDIFELKQALENSHATGSCAAATNYENVLFKKIKEIYHNENYPYFDVLREFGSQTCENIIRYKNEIMEKINEAGEKLFVKNDVQYIQKAVEDIDSIKKKIVQDSRSLTAFWYKREAMNVLKKSIDLMLSDLQNFTADNNFYLEIYSKRKKEAVESNQGFIKNLIGFDRYDEKRFFNEIVSYFNMLLGINSTKPLTIEHDNKVSELLRAKYSIV